MFGFGNKKVSTDEAAINDIMSRGVEEIFVRESFEKKLRSGKKLRVKLGFDPTGSAIHIGRAIVLRKLKKFQELGHTVIFIVGDFTAEIGDPSDKLEKRPMLSPADISRNVKDYKRQVGMILDLSKTEFHFNSSWLSKLTFKDVAALAESFSVQQMSARRNFKERFDKGEEVSLREFLYPLMQGYDSMEVGADIEIGGFDQLFNLKAGRAVQRHYGKPLQDVLTTKMLAGTDGRKMSTSWGNVITIVDEPSDMYGKVMSLNDELIKDYFLLATERSESDIADILKRLESGENPRDIKMMLASDIVLLYHGEKAARKAEQDFIETFKKGGIPDTTPTVRAQKGDSLSELAVKEKIVASKSEFRRLIEEGAVSDMERQEKVEDVHKTMDRSAVFKIGKRRFLKVEIEE